MNNFIKVDDFLLEKSDIKKVHLKPFSENKFQIVIHLKSAKDNMENAHITYDKKEDAQKELERIYRMLDSLS